MIPDGPLRFQPIFRPYLWGGRRLQTMLNKKIPDDGVWAESWEIVDHGQDQSVVVAGPFEGRTLGELIQSDPHAVLGLDANPEIGFPLLLKYLDCNRVLSVQVHPDDAYGARMAKPDLGKTEAWYVVDAEPGALIYAGLKPGIDRLALAEAIAEGRTEETLQTLAPKAGDCVFIPAGTIHALGAGLVVAEIQQASDTTFRLFDWNRVGDDGKSRPLHIEQALEVIDYNQNDVAFVERCRSELGYGDLLVDCDKFRLLELKKSAAIETDNGFVVVSVVKGQAILKSRNGVEKLALGESILIPAACERFELELSPNATTLLGLPPQRFPTSSL